MRNSAKKAEGKIAEVITYCGGANVVVEVNGKVLGGEIVPAIVAAGVMTGSNLHMNKSFLAMSAEEIINLVVDTAVKMEKGLYGSRHRENYEKAKSMAIKAFHGHDSCADDGEGDADENLEELDRILAQQSLDDEPEKSGE